MPAVISVSTRGQCGTISTATTTGNEQDKGGRGSGCSRQLVSGYLFLPLPPPKYLLRYVLGFRPSVLLRCRLGGRKGSRPIKNAWWGDGVVICLKLGADLHIAQLMPLPHTVSCFSKIKIGFHFLIPAHPGSPGKGAVKRARACVCMF